MTTFLFLLAVLVLVDVVVGVQTFLHERPVEPPPSHRAWSDGALPSGPYAVRH